MEVKKCFTCGLNKPKTKDFWQFDKNRIEPYGSCRVCINRKKSSHRIIKKAGIYATDKDICKRVKQKNLSKDLVEAQRLRLILLDRIKNKEHLIFYGNYIYCTVCNKQSDILTPISFKLLENSMKSFKKIHKHNGKG
jgi:hypothetical protein